MVQSVLQSLAMDPRQGIAHLNSVANFRRKGRDDLGAMAAESGANCGNAAV